VLGGGGGSGRSGPPSVVSGRGASGRSGPVRVVAGSGGAGSSGPVNVVPGRGGGARSGPVKVVAVGTGSGSSGPVNVVAGRGASGSLAPAWAWAGRILDRLERCLLVALEQLVLCVLEITQRLAELGDALGQVGELCMQLARGPVIGVGQIGLQHGERALEQIAAIAGVDELVQVCAPALDGGLQRLERTRLTRRQPEPADLELLAIEDHPDRAQQLRAAFQGRIAHRFGLGAR